MTQRSNQIAIKIKLNKKEMRNGKGRDMRQESRNENG